MSNDDQRLAPLRAQIDAIDQELLELLSMTGGVYKAWERIHRGMLIRDY